MKHEFKKKSEKMIYLPYDRFGRTTTFYLEYQQRLNNHTNKRARREKVQNYVFGRGTNTCNEGK